MYITAAVKSNGIKDNFSIPYSATVHFAKESGTQDELKEENKQTTGTKDEIKEEPLLLKLHERKNFIN